MVSAVVLVGADATTIGVVERFDAGGYIVSLHVQIIHGSTQRRGIHFAAGR